MSRRNLVSGEHMYGHHSVRSIGLLTCASQAALNQAYAGVSYISRLPAEPAITATVRTAARRGRSLWHGTHATNIWRSLGHSESGPRLGGAVGVTRRD